MSLSRSWHPLAFVVAVACLGFQLGAYFLAPVRDVESAGKKPTLIQEFGSGTGIAQSFLMPRDGLRSLTIALSSDAPATVTFDFELVRKGPALGWPDENVLQQAISVAVPTGTTAHTIDFPVVARAKGRTFVARFRLTRAGYDGDRSEPPATQPKIALVAWADDALPGGSISVGSEDRWGDLAISAEADPATRLQRTIDALNASLPTDIRLSRGTLVAASLLYASFVLMLSWSAIKTIASGVDRKGDDLAPASQRSRQTWVASLGALALSLGASILFIEALAAREPVAVDLIDNLDRAVMESPAGMHGGFSLVTEVINGDSPPALFAHPPSRVTWTVPVPEGRPMLRTTVALRPVVWERKSDGVTFDISVREGDRATTASRFLNPGAIYEDRAWVEVDVDLAPYAGRTVEITFATSSGPAGDPAWDWAMWGHPRVVER